MRSPVTVANRWRNASAAPDRHARWREARDELWKLIGPFVDAGATVAIVGAGNVHDVPLGRLTRRASRVDLIDIDRAALRRAVRRGPRGLRAVRTDVTAGWADRIVRDVVAGRRPPSPPRELPALGDYDLVIGDLFYSQLLYPALLDAGVPPAHRAAALAGPGRELTAAVVDRLHRASRTGVVVHLHDVAGWWAGHSQPVDLQDALALGLRALERLSGPLGCDPRESFAGLGLRVLDTRLWRWPFCDRVDYLVCGTVAAHSTVNTSAEGRAPSW